MIACLTAALCAQLGNRLHGKGGIDSARTHNGGGHITRIMFPGT